MSSKEQIKKLRNYAELAQAAYFYFDLENYLLQEDETIITLKEIVSLKI